MIRRTKQVRNDLIEIYGYIYERRPRAAEAVLDAIERAIRALPRKPTLGRRWATTDDRLAGMRVFVVSRYPSYLIFFRPVGRDIEVFRVLHGARELERLIDEIELDFED